MSDDDNHVSQQAHARNTGSSSAVFDPITQIGENTRISIKAADSQPPSAEPYWMQLLAGNEESGADVAQSDTSSESDTDTEHAEAPAQDDDHSHDSMAEILAALLGQSFCPDLVPFVQYSYDLSEFESPPHPSGFFDELAQLEKIKADFVERYQQRLRDVEASDAAYIASLEARGMQVKAKPRTRLARVRWAACKVGARMLRPVRTMIAPGPSRSARDSHSANRASATKTFANRSPLGERIIASCIQRFGYYVE